MKCTIVACILVAVCLVVLTAEGMQVTTQAPDDVAGLNAACESGQLTSCTTLGIDYLEGRGRAKDENKARALFERTCSGGDARGCNNLGIIYAGGRSAPKDEARAVQLYQRGCDGGYANACTNLGTMYASG